ncbi:hypothetical protein AAEX28_15965 [Lentisphaerota bacterium WC36G]|nr:hypothetical protein LJT99_02725 [Lentisphaerae bacterium WC36]
MKKIYNRFDFKKPILKNINNNISLIYNNYFEQKYVRYKVNIFTYLYYVGDNVNIKKLNPAMTFEKISDHLYYGRYKKYIELAKFKNILSNLIWLLFLLGLLFSYYYFRKQEK